MSLNSSLIPRKINLKVSQIIGKNFLMMGLINPIMILLQLLLQTRKTIPTNLV